MSTDAEKPVPFAFDLLLGYVLLGLQPWAAAVLAQGGMTVSQSLYLRFISGALFILLICVLRRRGLTTKNPKMLLLRGLLGGGAVLLYFTSIAEVGAARATLLNYTYPIWANLFSWLLGDRPPKSFWVGLLLAFSGIWFVIVPEKGLSVSTLALGDLAGLVSAMLAGAAVLTIKRLRQTDESLTIVAAFTVAGLCVSVPNIPFVETTATLFDRRWLLPAWAVGLTSFWGHVFFTRGYRGATVAQATLLSLIVPLLAAVCGVVFLGEDFGRRRIFGATLVASSLVLGIFVTQKQRVMLKNKMEPKTVA